eukprot:CAMPEP_0176378816 /NCGR_PEP_ID=MMETSP0126-20121128/29897_1 /TAXON_ID=141414 ORGANISM="Strombidinopsis acuminatum, Strain SPMC142" /NCGR_SAMPLE_ID=MMETSP0126 /ASSEMBLY_ACC=CAM_ASM_000229 /LENGTH=47 /DNA_ID= /DNA_START= /DNA_END= /DNA_ORIENTATION=
MEDEESYASGEDIGDESGQDSDDYANIDEGIGQLSQGSGDDADLAAA